MSAVRSLSGTLHINVDSSCPWSGHFVDEYERSIVSDRRPALTLAYLMNRFRRIVFVVASVCGMIFFGFLVAAHFLAATVRTVGMLPISAAASPRDAYLILRGRRDMRWHGLHIHVDSTYVLDASDTVVRAGAIVPSPYLLMLEPGVVFVATDDSGSMRFARARDHCGSSKYSCTVREPVPAGGRGVCLQYSGKPKDGDPGDFELLRCWLPTGIEARTSCFKPDCGKREKILYDAFASASGSTSR